MDLEDFAPAGALNPDYDSLEYDGRVYRVDPGSGAVETVDRDLRFTNGIAFGPDGRLYVAETLAGMIHRYDWNGDAGIGARTPFGKVTDPDGPGGVHGPDGMKFGADGNLYIAIFGQGHVAVMNPQGQVIRRHKTDGLWCTNLHFGADGEQCVYVTEGETGSVQIIDVGVDGFPLHHG